MKVRMGLSGEGNSRGVQTAGVRHVCGAMRCGSGYSTSQTELSERGCQVMGQGTRETWRGDPVFITSSLGYCCDRPLLLPC